MNDNGNKKINTYFIERKKRYFLKAFVVPGRLMETLSESTMKAGWRVVLGLLFFDKKDWARLEAFDSVKYEFWSTSVDDRYLEHKHEPCFFQQLT